MKKWLSLLLSVLLLLGCAPLVHAAEEVPEGYTGIYSIDDLYMMRYGLDQNYILMDDIDMTEDVAEGGLYDGGNGWKPVDIGEDAFTGIFDGNGHTIFGMDIRGAYGSYTGLFGKVADGEIKNLTMTGVTISTTSENTGCLAAYATNEKFDNIILDYTISNAGKYTGGVVGYCSGQSVLSNISVNGIINSSSEYIGGALGYGIGDNKEKPINISKIKADIFIQSNKTARYISGVCGFCNYSELSKIKSYGSVNQVSNKESSDVSHSKFVSGIVASISNSKLAECKNNCEIKNILVLNNHSSYDRLTICSGGVCAYSNNSSFFNAVNFADISADSNGNGFWYADREGQYNHIYSYIGGIVGNFENSQSVIQNCYNIGIISTNVQWTTNLYSWAGGIAGKSGSIETSYNTGKIESNTSDCRYYHAYSGGICGMGNVTSCINLGNVSRGSAISDSGTLTNNYYLYGTASQGMSSTADTTATAVSLSAAQSRLQRFYVNLDFENTWFLDLATGIEHPQLIANPESEYEHTHDYKTEVIDPTCTARGYTLHTCACGDSYKDSYVDELGHDYGAWTQTKAPTCTEKGEERRDCSRCDAFETREVNANGHSYTDVVTKPTCTEKGYTTHTCSACQDSFVDSYVDALGHDYKAVVTKPTCTEQGYTTYTCSRCHYSYIADYVPANGHTEGEWKITKQPTLTSEGIKTLYCSVCGKVIRTESIPKLTQGRVYSVKIDDVSLNYKKSTTLKPNTQVDDGVKYTVKYESSNTKVATVDQNGNVTATKRGSGSATITCTVTDQYGNVVKDTCTVNVSLSFGQKIIVYVLFGWIWY